MIQINKLPPFKRMCVTIGNLPTSFMESMSYYEALEWLYKYLADTIIPTVNNTGEAVTELQNAFTLLQAYVDNYFDNLDVQEEINNKLDAMAESGELTDIIAQYLGLAGLLTFNTVADMKLAENLANGSTVKTFGFHSINDGGAAYYKVRTITNDDVIDEMTIIALYDNTLIAELMIESKMNVEQFGAYGDNTHDDTAAIQKAINECNSIVLSNIYKTTDQLSINEPTTIIGIKENKINTTLSGKKSIFKVLSNNVIFDNISAELTYSGGGSTGEDGNVISIGTYYMNAARGLENIIIRNCNLKRTGTLSYNVAIFGDTHDVIVENCKIYGECVNLHWSGDFDEAHPDTSTCTKTYHPYNVIIQNNVLENNRGVFLSSAYNVKILNNTFISNTDGITVSAGDYGNTLALGAQKNAILTGITIENCSFNEYSGKALTLNGYGYRENDLTYQKNYITHSNVLVKNSTFGDSSQNATTAIITPTLFYNLTIEGCNFKSTRQQAYYSLCSFNSVIRDCSFDVAGTPITFFGDNNSIVDHCNGVIASGYN